MDQPGQQKQITFLFHTGSVKRTEFQSKFRVDSMFLFHTGSIKRINIANYQISRYEQFLFHTGSIKRSETAQSRNFGECFYSILVRLKGHCKTWLHHPVTMFLFHTGSIKRNLKIDGATETQGNVSIPYWFD